MTTKAAYKGSGTHQVSGTSQTVSFSSGIDGTAPAAGDIIGIWAAYLNTSAITTHPLGLSAITYSDTGSTCTLAYWEKELTSGDITAGGLTIVNNTSQKWAVLAVWLTGGNTSGIRDGSVESDHYTTSGTTRAAPDLTTTMENDLLVTVVAERGTTVSTQAAASPYTRRNTVATASSGGIDIAFADDGSATNGVGTQTGMSWTGMASDTAAVTMTLAYQPTPSSGYQANWKTAGGVVPVTINVSA